MRRGESCDEAWANDSWDGGMIWRRRIQQGGQFVKWQTMMEVDEDEKEEEGDETKRPAPRSWLLVPGVLGRVDW
jgi:hypothetical protein